MSVSGFLGGLVRDWVRGHTQQQEPSWSTEPICPDCGAPMEQTAWGATSAWSCTTDHSRSGWGSSSGDGYIEASGIAGFWWPGKREG